ncbi:MAG: outer membrane protein assembly factor BamE [Beijerinckiaceae bacterium]|nr:outer membrane protein assembly factor BamE [Beijerinckiaceae bacterium]
MVKVFGANTRKGAFAAVLLASAAALGGCQTETLNKGYIVDEQALAQIKVGSSAEQVILVLGTPSTTSTVGSKTYYYISQRTEKRFAFQQPTIVDQRVLAIYLDKANKVERIANYGLQDGVVFDFISRKTETGGADQAFLKSLFRSLGNIFPS